MSFITKTCSVIPYLNELKNNRFIRNLSYMGFAQIANRIFRLSASIVVARMLFPEDYGVAALALTVNELLHVVVRGAVVNKLVQSNDDEATSLCDSAYWINWILCIALLIIQSTVAIGLGWWHEKIELGLAIATLALTYLVLPFGTIQAALTLRDNRLEVTARSETLQTLVDSVFTILLAITGWGLWALVIPKLLAAPVWALVYRQAHQWEPRPGFNIENWKKLFYFGRHIIAGDAVITLRNNIDYILIAHFLGMEALGIYFFAYNAGLGVTQGFINAFTTTLYPHLCDCKTTAKRIQRYKKTIIAISFFTIPLILVQSGLASFYVPLIFGERWVEAGAIPIVILICLSALTRPFAEAASQLLRASGHPNIDLIWQSIFTIVLTIALVIGVNWDLYGIALATLIVHLVLQPIFAYWTATKTVHLSHSTSVLHSWRKLSCQQTH